ncbi:hypothetical protein AB1M95_02535 [Sulfitobacter sp. LCG007]
MSLKLVVTVAIPVAALLGFVVGAATAATSLPAVSILAGEPDQLTGEVAIMHPTSFDPMEIAASVCGGELQVEDYTIESSVLAVEWARFECAKQGKVIQ